MTAEIAIKKTTKATAAPAAMASTFLLARSSWVVVTMLEKFTEPVFVSLQYYISLVYISSVFECRLSVEIG